LFCFFVSAEVMKWPRAETELRKVAEGFRETAGFPGVVGAFDGTYIEMKGTTGEARSAYICRKGFTAMHLQVY
jgi:hypothetical protein